MTGILPIHSLQDYYKLHKKVGDGSFGDVRLATQYRTGAPPQLVAVKTIRSQLPLLEYSELREVDFLTCVPSSPYLVYTFEVFVDTMYQQCHIVMEAMDQNLWQFMQDRTDFLPGAQAKSMLHQIISGIAHIHSYGFYHRDLKPENVLVQQHSATKTVVKIGDFGLSRYHYCQDPITTYVSTRWYRAPELLLQLGSYSFGVDIWAFGVMAVELINLQPLFPGDSEFEQLDRQMRGLGTPRQLCFGGNWFEFYQYATTFNMPVKSYAGFLTNFDVFVRGAPYSPSLALLVNSCLKWNPLMRPTSRELACHAYFTAPIIANKPKYNGTCSSLVDNDDDYFTNAIMRLDKL